MEFTIFFPCQRDFLIDQKAKLSAMFSQSVTLLMLRYILDICLSQVLTKVVYQYILKDSLKVSEQFFVFL